MISTEKKPESSFSTELIVTAGNDLFRRRRGQFTLVLAVVVALVAASSVITQFSYGQALSSIPKAVGWLVTNIYPDAKALSKIPEILTKLFQTIVVSVTATTAAAAAAFALAIVGSKTTRVHPFFTLLARAIGSLFRNIPVVAWAMILLLSFGQGMLTGLLALFFETFGFLVRSFLETIDETAHSSVEALLATGATYGHTIFQAVLPSTLPQALSWILYMIETNIRSATLVGILTGSGIGFTFDLYYKSMNYRAAALVVISIVVVVLLIEVVSNSIRRMII